jgi:hypothetical protein
VCHHTWILFREPPYLETTQCATIPGYYFVNHLTWGLHSVPPYLDTTQCATIPGCYKVYPYPRIIQRASTPGHYTVSHHTVYNTVCQRTGILLRVPHAQILLTYVHGYCTACHHTCMLLCVCHHTWVLHSVPLPSVHHACKYLMCPHMIHVIHMCLLHSVPPYMDAYHSVSDYTKSRRERYTAGVTRCMCVRAPAWHVQLAPKMDPWRSS